jgi:hypothetical protein
MKYSTRITTALGLVATVALGATLIAAVAQDGPDQNHPRRPDGRPRIERRSRENRRAGERPVTQQRRELAGTGADCTHSSVGLTPLTELGRASYKGFEGGLYRGGENAPPSEHESAGEALAKGIEPLSPSGERDPDGRYVLLSIGMSNAQTEFTGFKQLTSSDPDKDPGLVVVNGAQGGVASPEWSNPSDPAWTRVNAQLVSSGVTPEQVTVAWVKVADQIRPWENPPFPQHARDLEADMAAVARILKERYPNIRLAYYSSRIYGGYGSDNREPFAYESGFSVKWLVDAQIEGAADLNFDAAAGPVDVPWIGWGPYLWADGVVRRNDGLSWDCSDFAEDGTHPGKRGVDKVAGLVLDFVHTDPSAAQWYLNDP